MYLQLLCACAEQCSRVLSVASTVPGDVHRWHVEILKLLCVQVLVSAVDSVAVGQEMLVPVAGIRAVVVTVVV